jgi:hypothetical protein
MVGAAAVPRGVDAAVGLHRRGDLERIEQMECER